MAYLNIDLDYFDPTNVKRSRLLILLGPTGDIYPIRMWRALWKTSIRKRELCDRFSSSEHLELVCEWRGETGQLTAALIQCGILEKDTLEVHGWKDGLNGRAIDAYLRKAEYMANKRQQLKEPSEATGTAGLVKAFAFCASPGQAAKAAAIADLVRQGIPEERIMAAATDPANRQTDFYQIVKALRPNGLQPRESGVDQYERLKRMGKQP